MNNKQTGTNNKQTRTKANVPIYRNNVKTILLLHCFSRHKCQNYRPMEENITNPDKQ